MIDPADLVAMLEIASARWRLDAPFVGHHAGDLAWGSSPSRGEPECVLLDGGYAFVDGTSWHLGGPDSALPGLVELARERGQAVYALTRETAKVAALRAAGFTPSAEEAFWHLVHDLRDLPPVAAPVVTGESDLDARVALHRDAWTPSRFTPEVYDRVRAAPLYDPDLDVVVLTPDGEWAAYCIGWYDAGSATGELEPVGTARAFRRQGYGTAACHAALHRFRERGARYGVVYAVDDPANPGAKALYESAGFRAMDRHVRFLPPARQNAAL